MVTVQQPAVEFDAERGGRWTSLRAGGREWLWRRPDPARRTVRPGDAFVDVGGVEECVPTIRGLPDHGDAWSRPWRAHSGRTMVQCPDFELDRRIIAGPAALHLVYTLRAEPGYRFLWAAHALLDLSEQAVLSAPEGTPTRLFPEAAGLLTDTWPSSAPYVTGNWPEPRGLRLDRLGPDDGTAVGAVLVGCDAIGVADGPDVLNLRLYAEPDVPVSIALWRNMGGFPHSAPYRSVGVEPMLGSVFDLADAGPHDAAVVPPTGELRWALQITAARRHEH
ncbi:hypothetical protein ABH926_000933 [Catenulispora sp. GP43]|uniref:hypothetical protein n=1 Tax=Catenulispora sp. GP43 TaxID=3156263 RepID=UPI00351954A1